jgi:hypothetical protein
LYERRTNLRMHEGNFMTAPHSTDLLDRL